MASVTPPTNQSSSSTSTSNTFTVSQTFSNPFPSATSTDGGRDRNRNNQPDTTFGNTSASLYLYTFLATLVLLLGVSAAIILRSLLLRRRHRRMVEEAIRNGTWIPPANLPRGGIKIDLSKKPKMWEAMLGGGGYVDAKALDAHSYESRINLRDWSGLMPMALQVLPEPEVTKKNDTNAENVVENNTANSPQTMYGQVLQYIGWRSRPSTPATANSVPARTRGGQDSLPEASNSPSTIQQGSVLPTPPVQVRLSLLIAMPAAHPVIPPLKPGEAVDGEGLPCLEMGCVDIRIDGENESSSSSGSEETDLGVSGGNTVEVQR